MSKILCITDLTSRSSAFYELIAQQNGPNSKAQALIRAKSQLAACGEP